MFDIDKLTDDEVVELNKILKSNEFASKLRARLTAITLKTKKKCSFRSYEIDQNFLDLVNKKFYYSDGQIINRLTGKPAAASRKRKDRLYIIFMHNAVRYSITRSRLTYMLVTGEILNDFEIIHHINEDSEDDRIENLEKLTQLEHMIRHNNKFAEALNRK
jgi:hypothetical protein